MSRRAEDDLAAAACRALVQGQTAEAKRLAVRFLAAESQRAADRRSKNAVRQRRFKRSSNAVGNAETALANAETALPEALLSTLPAPLLSRALSSPDQDPAAAAPKDLKAKTRGYIAPLTVVMVATAWHSAMKRSGRALRLSAATAWRDEYEAVVAAIVAVVPEANRAVAVVALCDWFWLAPDGPIQSGRVGVHGNPLSLLAKYVSSDLEAADAWYAQELEAREAAQ